MKRIKLKAKVGLVSGEEISLSANMFPATFNFRLP